MADLQFVLGELPQIMPLAPSASRDATRIAQPASVGCSAVQNLLHVGKPVCQLPVLLPCWWHAPILLSFAFPEQKFTADDAERKTLA